MYLDFGAVLTVKIITLILSEGCGNYQKDWSKS